MTVKETQKSMGTVEEIKSKNILVGSDKSLAVTYRLEKTASVYLISAFTENEEATTFAGNTLAVAEEIFDAVSEGGVTPCTLNDVCRDLLLEISTKLFTNR